MRPIHEGCSTVTANAIERYGWPSSMRNFRLGLLLVIVFAGCDRRPASPIGIKEWTEVQSLAEAFVLKGDVGALRRHADFSALPANDLPRLNKILDTWQGIPGKVRHVSTEVMTPAEFEAREEKEWLALSGGRPSTLPPTKWHIQPEKLVVFSFVSSDPSNKLQVRWYIGAFRKDGLWYFVTSDLF
jgi:hypothetical protein